MPSWKANVCASEETRCMDRRWRGERGSMIFKKEAIFTESKPIYTAKYSQPRVLRKQESLDGQVYSDTFKLLRLYNSFLMENCLKCTVSCFMRQSILNGTHSFNLMNPWGYKYQSLLNCVQFVPCAHLVAIDSDVDTDRSGLWAGEV